MKIDYSTIEFFKGLPDSFLDKIFSSSLQENILSGEILIEEKEQSESLYIVISGRFKVCVSGKQKRFTEIGPGHPIGEIGFFTGSVRTATVTAIRDCVVLKLTKSDFLSVCNEHPEIWQKLIANLANRLALTTQGTDLTQSKPGTITICPAGSTPLPESFFINFKTVASRIKSTLCISYSDCVNQFGKTVRVNSPEVTNWLSKLEQTKKTVFFFTDSVDSDWSSKVIRHADQVLLVGLHDNNQKVGVTELNELEHLVVELHKPQAIRLVLLHKNACLIEGSKMWLANRKTTTHHHICINNLAHYRRLWRFINGEAIGLVASGGGAYSAAHIGMYKALTEAGIEFDIMGGTSGGGAMTAAFSMGIDIDDMNDLVHEIFIKNNAMSQFTWPRYSILDHTVFDREMRNNYTDQDISDLWVNFFALSVNLSDGCKYLHRSGPIWEAVRATSSIPGLLPPVYTEDGKILIDGGVVDNVPLKSMKELKSGPNVILSFAPKYNDDINFSYSSLPGRNKLIGAKLNPFSRLQLPDALGVGTVLLRSMGLNNSSFEKLCAADDLNIIPKLPLGIGLIDWQKHKELASSAYQDVCRQLEVMQKNNNPVLLKISKLLED